MTERKLISDMRRRTDRKKALWQRAEETGVDPSELAADLYMDVHGIPVKRSHHRRQEDLIRGGGCYD